MSEPVPSQFPLGDCKLAFLAEAPGAEELIQGKPLVGPAGRVYNAMLRVANIDRAAVYTGNVFEHKAPDNDVQPWLRGEEYREYREGQLARLQDELRACQPTVVVPMGGPALYALTGNTTVSRFRGSADTADYIVPGTKILPTYHPAHVMRQWHLFTTTVGDFIRAQEEADLGPELVLPERRFLLEPTIEEFREYMHDRLLHSDLLSVDIETGWGQITSIAFAPDQYESMCVPFIDKRNPNRSYWGSPEEELEAWKLVKDIMESDVPKLGQNMTFDAYWLLANRGIRTYNYMHDTRLIHHALYPPLEKDLASMGGNYSRQGNWKSWSGGQAVKRDD